MSTFLKITTKAQIYRQDFKLRDEPMPLQPIRNGKSN